MVKVLFLALHAMCSSQIHTKAFGVEVARAACSAHHSGTLTNRSEALRARPTLGGAAADTRRWKAWNNPGGAAHALPSDGDVLVDLLDCAFDHQRIMHAADQFNAAPGGQDTGEAHDVGLDSLDGPVSDGARVAFSVGVAGPTHRTAHHAGVERVCNPILRPGPIGAE